jgi:hypothetical protein
VEEGVEGEVEGVAALVEKELDAAANAVGAGKIFTCLAEFFAPGRGEGGVGNLDAKSVVAVEPVNDLLDREAAGHPLAGGLGRPGRAGDGAHGVFFLMFLHAAARGREA